MNKPSLGIEIESVVFGVILDDLVSAAYAAGLLVLQLRLMG